MIMRKFLFLTLSVAVVFAACKNDKNDPEPDPINPSDTTKTDTVVTPGKSGVNSLRYLKTYVDRAEHPDFKFSGALDVNEFHNNRNGLRDTVTAHFDEIVAGNAMKYASVVDGGGNMNFNRVKQFVTDAKNAGLTIYGHTLAWHSQQQPSYLMGLMADKELEVPESEKVDIEDCNITYSKLTSWNYWKADFVQEDNNVDYSIKITKDGVLISNKKKANNNYMVQYQIANSLMTKIGTSYTMTIKAQATGDATLNYSVGSWYPDNFSGAITIDNTMKEYTVTVTPKVDGGFVLLQTGDFVGDITIESLKITHKGSDKTIPLTAEQKRDTLKWAMDRWIAGMMEATDGYVKAWDVVNEALAGDDKDKDGIYDLQSYELNNNGDPTNVASGVFYWQYYMGDLEYMRTAVASARKHFKGNPDELKLFVNDYNLESDWDDNKKVKSLVEWIKKWEADGVTKIDGIGTQMHISCFEDEGIQANIEKHIVKMFEIMAASGKLCRISELDMGYVRGNSRWSGTKLKTSQVTKAEHQKMADFYKFIIKKYFEIIPAAQQYGICQWCLTDAPDGGGWRGGEPVGIWTEGFKARKAVYGGFADGLAGAE
ncbi:MAG: endo-1,4-beta-xylanase [Salinivirgaceae bacterium]|nr:endo-1,4-beta-xylanase [Salinivirgaceae bacterium]